jgi:hypothetical protein
MFTYSNGIELISCLKCWDLSRLTSYRQGLKEKRGVEKLLKKLDSEINALKALFWKSM